MLGELMSDPARGKRVMDAVLKMRKLDIETLKNA
jgi:predicted 3-demethylubiquinone-9 3-methyltransferase (glyoxalase superfamily)